ncbi:hypothetical protein AVEN_153874-1 [Araneus ventricosus]|uniref:Uncharacterized protein n=1 Tax=Araneus ventricosus TaxID=182803 RepID=A0A4Y2LTQ6_ARAVE|nr:hypothetical protein AVEN_153874-1 [Araneus ventricosus]
MFPDHQILLTKLRSFSRFIDERHRSIRPVIPSDPGELFNFFGRDCKSSLIENFESIGVAAPEKSKGIPSEIGELPKIDPKALACPRGEVILEPSKMINWCAFCYGISLRRSDLIIRKLVFDEPTLSQSLSQV